MSNLLKTDNMWLNLHCKGGLSIKHYSKERIRRYGKERIREKS